jgi:hypothetical protein
MKLFIAVLGIALFAGQPAFASERLTQPALVDALKSVLNDSNVASEFYSQGWSGSAAIIRCAKPEGTGNASDRPYCEVAQLTGLPPRSVKITYNAVIALLSGVLSNSKLSTGFVLQGWVGSAVILRCMDPVGTAYGIDKKTCELESTSVLKSGTGHASEAVRN